MARRRAPEGLFTLTDACFIAGVQKRTLRDWIKRGVICPIHPPAGSGATIFLSFRNVLEMAMIHRLRMTLSLAEARKAVAALNEMAWEGPSSEFWLISSRAGWRLRHVSPDRMTHPRFIHEDRIDLRAFKAALRENAQTEKAMKVAA